MSNNHAAMLLSKVIDSENFEALDKNGITEDIFLSKADKEAYKFIDQYRRENGAVPSYAAVVEANDGFNYVPGVTDSFGYLAGKIRTRRAQAEFNELMSSTETANFINENKDDMEKVISTLTSDLNSINIKYANTRSVGKRITDSRSFMEEYRKRQNGESYEVWKSFLPYLNEEMGGYASGNFYVLFAKSGRGKSVIALREALEFAMQGATVLYWGLEMDYYGILTRLYSMLSAKLGKTTLTMNGEKFNAGFGTKDLRHGTLSEDFEESFEEMLRDINEYIPGEIVVKSVDDPDFTDRSVKQIEMDAHSTNADVIILDPLYLLDTEINTSKTAGGDAAATSKKIRMMAGQLDLPIIGVTQSEEGEEASGEGIRELKVPDRKAVKKSKSYLEDSSAVIGLDSDYTQSRGIIGIQKGRNGGEGSTAEMTFVPSYGIVEQLVIDASDFNF